MTCARSQSPKPSDPMVNRGSGTDASGVQGNGQSHEKRPVTSSPAGHVHYEDDPESCTEICTDEAYPPGKLRTVPITLSEANSFVGTFHRHHGTTTGHKLSTGVVDGTGELRGVAIMSRPVARMIDHRQVIEVVRVATDGAKNACSALYGACCRIADDTLLSEPGTSLVAAGWHPIGVTDGGSWSRPSRSREDDHPLDRKVKWGCRHCALPAIDLEAVRAA